MGKLNTLQARHEGYIAGLHGAPSTPPMTSEDVRRAYEAGYDLGRERRTPPASQSEALVTQADWDAAERYFSEANPADVFHGTELAQAFAQHRIAARREGIEEAAKVAAGIRDLAEKNDA